LVYRAAVVAPEVTTRFVVQLKRQCELKTGLGAKEA
jgi:hypothetical protein